MLFPTLSRMNTILLIEDNFEFLENLTEYLELEGYSILIANNGRKGVELAREFMPDIIVCDVLMREMDGHEVLQQLICTANTHEIPFIFSTSMSEKVEREEALYLGADDYIIKPYDADILLKKVQDLIVSGSKRKNK